MGPLWLDVNGYELDSEDKDILQHPNVGGVILFARNYHDSEQLIALNHAIRHHAKRPILIGVDQEGGRVQRFKEGFTLLPPAQAYANMNESEHAAQLGGWLMAAELIAHDVDLSFAPVLDMTAQCKAIGDRAFGDDQATILSHSFAYMKGMKQAGMATTGKHFPGHGGVIVDSHYETPFDHRDTILEKDMALFQSSIDANMLDAMMPAHVVYPHYDEHPASGSAFWLKTVLRQQLGFKGIIFSDDLNMEGAAIMGGAAQRAQHAMHAGCDMILMCNNRQGVVDILDHLPIHTVSDATPLFKKTTIEIKALRKTQAWQDAVKVMAQYWETGSSS